MNISKLFLFLSLFCSFKNLLGILAERLLQFAALFKFGERFHFGYDAGQLAVGFVVFQRALHGGDVHFR